MSKQKNDLTINDLNIDCLVLIFNYLTELEKIEASFVCRRWASFLAKNLDINYELLNEINKKMEAVPFILDFIKTCGSYLNSLKINFKFTNPDYISFILNEIARNCKNMTHFNLNILSQTTDSNVNEDDIESIFTYNFSLSDVTLHGLNMSGKSLLKLQTFIIKDLKISDCYFTSASYFNRFLSELKNLEKLYIDWLSSADINLKVIKNLNESNCESITEFCVYLKEYEKDEIIDLGKLLSKQKKLRLLKSNVEVDRKFLECLPKNYLEVLGLSSIENNPINYPFPCFKNLKVLQVSELAINDEFVKGLTECKNLKVIKIFEITEYLLTEVAESSFNQLQNLESFMITAKKINLDNVLVALSQCENLKDISINNCLFTDIGIQSLCLISELTDLDVSGSNLTNKQMKKLLKNLINLKNLNIDFCYNVSAEIVKEIQKKIQHKKDNDWISKNLERISYIIKKL